MYNKLYNTYPILAHGCGKLEHLPLWNHLLKNYCDNPRKIYSKEIDEIAFITVRNNNEFGYNEKKLNNFEKSISRWGIKPLVVIDHEKNRWRNTKKVPLLINAIKNVEKKYIVVADSSDVFMVNDPINILSAFKVKNCKMLFNAEKNIWPLDLEKEIIEFELNIAENKTIPYLNAGLWMGESQFALEILKEMKHCIQSSKSFEQYCYKLMYNKYYPNIKVDTTCSIFQNINRVDSSVLKIRCLTNL